MKQIARNVTMDDCGALRDCRYLLHDRDTKFTRSFRAIVASGRVKPLALPARSPNLNAYAERWVRSVKEECLSKVILFGERSLRRALREYVEHFHAERNHQGKGNVLLFPPNTERYREGPVRCRERWVGCCVTIIERRRDAVGPVFWPYEVVAGCAISVLRNAKMTLLCSIAAAYTDKQGSCVAFHGVATGSVRMFGAAMRPRAKWWPTTEQTVSTTATSRFFTDTFSTAGENDQSDLDNRFHLGSQRT